MSVQMLVLLLPVLLGIMGFAVDLGRLYLVRGELTHAAEAMAIAAASKLIGTDTGLSNATAAAQATLDDTTGHGNKYNFGSLVIGQSTGLLTSTVSDPTYFATAAGAIADNTNSGDTGHPQRARFIAGRARGEPHHPSGTGAEGSLAAAAGSGPSRATPSPSFARVMAPGREIAWASAHPPACGSAVVPTIPPSSVTQAMCG